jgi:hypothetical protein
VTVALPFENQAYVTKRTYRSSSGEPLVVRDDQIWRRRGTW